LAQRSPTPHSSPVLGSSPAQPEPSPIDQQASPPLRPGPISPTRAARGALIPGAPGDFGIVSPPSIPCASPLAGQPPCGASEIPHSAEQEQQAEDPPRLATFGMRAAPAAAARTAGEQTAEGVELSSNQAAVDRLAGAVLQRDSNIDSLDVERITGGGWTPLLVAHMGDSVMGAPSLAVVRNLVTSEDERALEGLVEAGVCEALGQLLRDDPSDVAVSTLHGIATGGSLQTKARHSAAIVNSACAAAIITLTKLGRHGAPLLLLDLLSSSASNRSTLCSRGAVEAISSPVAVQTLVDHQRRLIGTLLRLAKAETADFIIKACNERGEAAALELIRILLENSDTEVQARAVQTMRCLVASPAFPPQIVGSTFESTVNLMARNPRMQTEGLDLLEALLQHSAMQAQPQFLRSAPILLGQLAEFLERQAAGRIAPRHMAATLRCVELLGTSVQSDAESLAAMLRLLDPLVTLMHSQNDTIEQAACRAVLAVGSQGGDVASRLRERLPPEDLNRLKALSVGRIPVWIQ